MGRVIHRVGSAIVGGVTGVFLAAIPVDLVLHRPVGQPVEDADVWNLEESGQFTREWQWFERRLEARGGPDDGE